MTHSVQGPERLAAREQFVTLVNRVAELLAPDEGYDELAERVYDEWTRGVLLPDSGDAPRGPVSAEKMAWCLERIVAVMREKGLEDDVTVSEIQDFLSMAGYDVPLRSYDPSHGGGDAPRAEPFDPRPLARQLADDIREILDVSAPRFEYTGEELVKRGWVRKRAPDGLRDREQFVALVKRTADELAPDEGYDELAERVWAALGSAPPEPERRTNTGDSAADTWWLIERPSAPTPIWWTGEPSWDGATPLYPWTSDANHAKRFPTKAAAEEAIEPLNGIKGVHTPFGVATEHVWIWRGDEPSYIGYQERGSAPRGTPEEGR